MLIALNGQRILMQNPAGPEKYTINMYSALSKVDTTNKYVVYFENEPSAEFWKSLCSNNPNWAYKVLPKKYSWTQYSLGKELFKNPPDVFFTPIHTLPVIRPLKTKYVVMVHGLEYGFTKNNANWFQKLVLGKTEWYVCTFANKLIVPTQATKQKILKKGWTEDSKIEIVNEGVSPTFYKRPPEEIKTVLTRYNLQNNPYLIFVSTIQPRKNLPRTIEAFAKAVKSNSQLAFEKLVIVGKKGWEFEESLAAPKKFGIENNVIFLGRAPDEDLPALISGAQGYVNFSLEEGFGLPLLESFACETPTAISDIPAFVEVGEDTPIYANPENVDQISAAIVQLLNYAPNPQNVLKGKQHSQKFTWENTARKTLDVLLNLK